MSALLQDLRFAIRSACAHPGHAIVTILVFAIAIGANTAIFSVLNGTILRPLPYPDSDRLVSISNAYPGVGLENASVSIPDFVDRRDRAPSLESIAIFNMVRRLHQGSERPEQVMLTRTSPSFFDVLRTDPAVGRAFTDAEAVPGADRVVVLSHAFWMSRFGGREDLIGQDIRFDGESFRVVGVMPEGFDFPNGLVEGWIPFAITPEQASDAQRGMEFSRSIGRLAENATIAGLNSEMDTIVRANIEAGRERSGIEDVGFAGRATNLQAALTGDLSTLLYFMQGLVLAVLLIACANIANLQLARAVARRQELSIRQALGASLGRLARLVLAENFGLAFAGAALGLVLCYLFVDLIEGLLPGPAGMGVAAKIDGYVLLFTCAAVVLATLVTGLFPLTAMRREDLTVNTRESSRVGTGRSSRRFRSALVVFQIAASVALLVSAGLLTRSFYALSSVDPGFEPAGVWAAGVVLPADRYRENDAIVGFYRRTLDELAALPGVAEAGFTSALPFSGVVSQASYVIDGYVPAVPRESPHANQRKISEGFFPALGMPVLQGRNFNATESQPVAIVDELFVRRYFPVGDVLGQRVRMDAGASQQWATIIGVVETVHHETLAFDPTKETIYWHFAEPPFAGGQIVLKTMLPPDQLTRTVEAVIARADPDVILADATPMDELVAQSVSQQNAAMTLTLSVATGALALAILGIYGVMTWSVTQRVGEIGIRMTLGASRSHVVGMVLRQSSRFVAIGLAIGIMMAAAVAMLLSAAIYEVSPADPMVYAAAIVTIALAALIASWLPARRAARVEPMSALRER